MIVDKISGLEHEIERLRKRNEVLNDLLNNQVAWDREPGHLPVPVLQDRYDRLVYELDRLRAAIVEHRAQKADDRCIEDDDRLYEALGDGIKCDRRVGSKADMLANCARFIGRRCEAGGWPSYQELERQRDSLLLACKDILRAYRSLLRSTGRSDWFIDRQVEVISTEAAIDRVENPS